jgi:hypothetical protein
MTVCFTLEGFIQNTATKMFRIGFQINHLVTLSNHSTAYPDNPFRNTLARDIQNTTVINTSYISAFGNTTVYAVLAKNLIFEMSH